MIIDPRQLVIFAGGKGTRLGSLGSECPKPAVNIDGRPLVSYLIDWAREQNFNEVILAAGHLLEVLKLELEMDYRTAFKLHDSQTWTASLNNNFRLLIRDTGKNDLTGQRLFRVADLVRSNYNFVVTYGDTLTEMDMQQSYQLSRRRNKLICMVAGHPDARYGELVIEDDLVTVFKEKSPPKFLVNRGFFVIKSEIFSNWSEANFLSFEEDVLPFFAAKREVLAYHSKDWFFSVDTEVDAEKLTRIMANRKKGAE